LHQVFARRVLQSGPAVVDQLLGNAKTNDGFFAGVNDSVIRKNHDDVITTIS
jgi:hypothetical protein